MNPESVSPARPSTTAAFSCSIGWLEAARSTGLDPERWKAVSLAATAVSDGYPACLADRHAPPAQVVLTWTALGAAVVAAPALWSRPTAEWPGTRALATLLAVLGRGAAPALAAPTPPARGNPICGAANPMPLEKSWTAAMRSSASCNWSRTRLAASRSAGSSKG
ncbi:hypothetical protein [Nonomuraea basaltis]|uniref:hypothetical protein n=1 Tax=Nonomuraea basaltis TaxID=2495887 RepID=UPI00198115FA|nr:hypothetical protein [Nonomuraea basaltis]